MCSGLALGLVLVATGPGEDYPVRIKVLPNKAADGTQLIRVTLQLEKGYFTIANPSRNEAISSETEIKVEGDDVEHVKISYPAGDVQKDEIIGDYRVYRGQVTVKAVVRRGQGRRPLLVKIRVRPLDQRGCLWGPRIFKVSVP